MGSARKKDGAKEKKDKDEKKQKLTLRQLYSWMWPIGLLLAYTIAGGVVFCVLQRVVLATHTEPQPIPCHAAFSKRYESLKLELEEAAGFEETLKQSTVEYRINSTLKTYLADIERIRDDCDSYSHAEEKPLDVLNAWYFAGIVYTGVGYGDISPKGLLGRMFVIVYAIFGMPLVVYCLEMVGGEFCSMIWAAHNSLRSCCRSIVCRKKDGNISSVSEFPLSAALAVTVAYLVLVSWLFMFLENWNFLDSFYFVFQTVATIGLGDITPVATSHRLLSYFFTLIGIALLSMCWNLVQLKLEAIDEEVTASLQKDLVASSQEQGTQMNGSIPNGTLPGEKTKGISDKPAAIQNNPMLSKLMSQTQKSRLSDKVAAMSRMKFNATQTDLEFMDRGEQINIEMQDESAQASIKLPPVKPVVLTVRDVAFEGNMRYYAQTEIKGPQLKRLTDKYIDPRKPNKSVRLFKKSVSHAKTGSSTPAVSNSTDSTQVTGSFKSAKSTAGSSTAGDEHDDIERDIEDMLHEKVHEETTAHEVAENEGIL